MGTKQNWFGYWWENIKPAKEGFDIVMANRPLLTAGKPEVRQYKAMFFLGKSEIGLASDVVPATAAP